MRGILTMMLVASLVAGCGRDEGENGTATSSRTNSSAVGETGDPAQSTLTQHLAQSGDLSTLANAVKAAGLQEALSGSGPYTLFAPANAAFGKIEGGSGSLMEPARKAELTNIITYHLVPGMVTAADLRRAIENAGGTAQIATLGGGTLTAKLRGDEIVLTGAGGSTAKVTQSDIMQSNGVVHMVDAVLMPQ